MNRICIAAAYSLHNLQQSSSQKTKLTKLEKEDDVQVGKGSNFALHGTKGIIKKITNVSIHLIPK